MRIVSLAPSNTEILYRLGLEDQILATTSLCSYPVEAAMKPSVSGWTDIDTEKVEEFNPDVAFASDDLQDCIVKDLRDSNVDVVQVRPHTLEEVYQSITKIGEVVNCKDKARKIVEEMRKRVNAVDLKAKRIYCEEWMDPPMVSGNWVPGLIEAGNGKYFIEQGERSREFKLEKLKEFSPEHIFLNICGAGKNVDTRKLVQRGDWKSITAVRNSNVHIIDDALLNRPSPRLAEGLEQICKKSRR